MDEVRKNATVFLHRQIPDEAVPQHIKDYMKRTGRKRGEGKKAGRGTVSTKAATVCPATAVVREVWCGNHGGVSHYRLPGDEGAEVVRG